MTNRDGLVHCVALAQKALEEAQANLAAFDASIENNVYASLDEASGKIEDQLRDQAFEDCQGAHNCGLDEYTQDFMVDGKKYRAIATFEYNRHDKMYYYIDGSSFSVVVLEEKD